MRRLKNLFCEYFLMRVKLYENGYEPFIDFFKGLAIIFVVFSHCASSSIRETSGFYFWAAAPTAYFMIIAVFHSFRRSNEVRRPEFRKLFNRLLKPFFVTQIIAFIILIIVKNGGVSSLLQLGRIGKGAYFPWVYIQFVYFCYFISPVFSKLKKPWFLFLLFAIFWQFFYLI